MTGNFEKSAPKSGGRSLSMSIPQPGSPKLPPTNKLNFDRMTDRTQAETASRPTTQHKGERKTFLDLSVDHDQLNSTNPNLIDLDTNINTQKVINAVEPKLLLEKRQKRMELLALQINRQNNSSGISYRGVNSSFNQYGTERIPI